MTRRKTKEDALGITKSTANLEDCYSTWNNEAERKQAFKAYGQCVHEFDSIERSQGFLWRDYGDLQPGISSRPGLTREDWRFYRPNECTPTVFKQILLGVDFYYYSIGIIRNTIDLMAEFGAQGMRFSHPNKRIEKFYRNWY